MLRLCCGSLFTDDTSTTESITQTRLVDLVHTGVVLGTLGNLRDAHGAEPPPPQFPPDASRTLGL